MPPSKHAPPPSGHLAASGDRVRIISLCIPLEEIALTLRTQADVDGNGVIDYDEFKECYASMGWNRVQGLARLLNEIQAPIVANFRNIVLFWAHRRPPQQYPSSPSPACIEECRAVLIELPALSCLGDGECLREGGMASDGAALCRGRYQHLLTL